MILEAVPVTFRPCHSPDGPPRTGRHATTPKPCFRLYPNGSQRSGLARAFGCARVVCNDALSVREAARAYGDAFPKTGDLSNLLITEAKLTDERAWLGEVSCFSSPCGTWTPRSGTSSTAWASVRAWAHHVSSPSGTTGRPFASPRTPGGRSSPAGSVVAEDRRCVGGWSRVLPSAPSTVTVVNDAAGMYFDPSSSRPNVRRYPRANRSSASTWAVALRNPLRRHEDRQPSVSAPGGAGTWHDSFCARPSWNDSGFRAPGCGISLWVGLGTARPALHCPQD
ncbi:helix-turn-helix domain-containing protein [Streptomyces achmelvichensis]|uniref:helix-turn-helix domain-containing protein n=1 Tax=Streptomyces achmelvichensis TaxID=3134111 RepID=UPI003C12B750